MKFSDRLKQFMQETGMNQKDICVFTNISAPNISQYIHGSHEPSNQRKREMAVALGLDENYFFRLIPEVIIEENSPSNMNVQTAAKYMGMSIPFIYKGLQEKRFPWGYAVMMEGWSYSISPIKFFELTGIDPDDNKVINLKVELAAKLLGKSAKFVRLGLQQMVFPWGYAVYMESCWKYWISSVKFTEHTGFVIPDNYLCDAA